MLGFMFQLYIALAVVFYRFPRKKYFWMKLVLFLAATLTVGYFFPEPVDLGPISRDVIVYPFFLIVYLFSYLFLLFGLDGSPYKILFYFMVGSTLQNAGYHLFNLTMRLMDVPYANQYAKAEYYLILTAYYFLFYGLFIVWDAIHRKNGTEFEVPKASIIVTSVFFFAINEILDIYIFHSSGFLDIDRSVAILYEVYSEAIDILLILLLLGIFSAGKAQREKEELAAHLAADRKYYEASQKNIEAINMKCHDLKHQIAAMKKMGNKGDSGEYISELENEVMIYESFAKSGNDALDIILTEKGLVCQQNGIKLSIIADGTAISFMTYNDIYSLFGNAMDNAIESLLKEKDPEKKILDLRVEKKGGMAYVYIENYSASAPQMKQGNFVTSKKEDGHGYGTKSMAYVVHKYHGNITFTYRDSVFAVYILMPIPEKTVESSTNN